MKKYQKERLKQYGLAQEQYNQSGTAINGPSTGGTEGFGPSAEAGGTIYPRWPTQTWPPYNTLQVCPTCGKCPTCGGHDNRLPQFPYHY